MSDPSGPAGPDRLHYPDVAAAGNLRAALQNEFDAASPTAPTSARSSAAAGGCRRWFGISPL
ncbi:hypothetical protein [Dactylosporangium salmoneum]|uniref:Uncharacterized protein n=1 Tax=Dactylosporangium salmoneum TaxID=53361 RepID=A0ABP5SCM9_9ACTN